MKKWPIHPLPLSNESLSNWLHRIAAEYSVPINDLLSLSLGWNDGIDSIEINPSDNVIQNISKKSGQKLSVLRNMTMAYLAPWIVDSLKIDNNDFVTYVNQFPVLLSKGVDDTFASKNWVPWNLNNPLSRVCPICIEENNGEIKSGWRYSFLLTCNIHSVRLKKAGIIKGKFKFNIIEEEVAITDSLLEMDRKSWQALDTGEVILKNRKVNCAIWFRVLRRIVHELCISPSRCGLKQSEIIKKIWNDSPYKKESVLSRWKSFEDLKDINQQKLLIAASTAIELLEKEIIKPCGEYGYMFISPKPEKVFDGVREYNPLKDAANEMKRLLKCSSSDLI